MPNISCRHFTGYKPCSKNPTCDGQCPAADVPSSHVLLLHLGALGAVVRSTSLLAAIHRRYPRCHLTWVTDAPAHQILQDHPLIDCVYTTSEADLLRLSSQNYDVALVLDKSKKAGGILRRLQVDQVFGFIVDVHTGAILPATATADELWQLGLSDHQKFFINQKPETQLAHEALQLGPWQRDAYCLPLLPGEEKEVLQRRQNWQKNPQQPVIGLNTGASLVLPAKKWTVSFQRQLLQHWLSLGCNNLVLLGGPEDHLRNQAIAENLSVAQSSTQQGLRDGYLSVQACDIVVSGDSLGLHLAIAAKKYAIAWFGPTCAHEIDLYGRGEKLLAKVDCGPCWKRICEKPVMCYDQVDLNELDLALQKGVVDWQSNQSWSCKPHSLEIFF